jgi:single-stranded-DNA-specific exonuclease
MPIPITLVQRPGNPVVASRLKAQGIDGLLAKLYASRGIKDRSEVQGSYGDLLPVDTLKNALAMANYLADCAVTHKRVLIVSDYDCDGATACAVLVMAFGASGMNFDYLVPDRVVHGYGLTPAIVEDAAKLEPRPEVIITVDNGISSNAGVDRANELGIDVLVTDHHLAPDTLPKARLIVNPNQPGCEFASKNIAGCGVAWYVARALVEELQARDMDPGFDPAELLSYVALGTVADVVKLDRNNRILVAEGLKYIRNETCAPGVLNLVGVSGKNPATLACSDIGFGVGPRINAAGRLAHMGAGVECLTTLDHDQALMLAIQLNETNQERKEIQREMVDEAEIQALRLIGRDDKAAADEFGRRSIVVYHPDWHEGVVGIVAGRLKEDRHRPTVVMTLAHDGTIKGSARSIPGFHLKHALDAINVKHPGVLLKFGGHAMAAGLTIPCDKLEEFREALEEVCKAGLTPEMLNKQLPHDGALPAHLFTVETVRELGMQVWGQGFEEPVFLNEFDVQETKVIGQDKTHLKIMAKLGDISTDLMAFGQADLVNSIGSKIVVAHKPQINNYRGESRLQVLVELMPEQLNPSLAPALRERQAIADEAAEASQGTSRDPGPARQVAQEASSRDIAQKPGTITVAAVEPPVVPADTVLLPAAAVAARGQQRMSFRPRM